MKKRRGSSVLAILLVSVCLAVFSAVMLEGEKPILLQEMVAASGAVTVAVAVVVLVLVSVLVTPASSTTFGKTWLPTTAPAAGCNF